MKKPKNSKLVTVHRDTYERLKARKAHPRASFNEVIEELLREAEK